MFQWDPDLGETLMKMKCEGEIEHRKELQTAEHRSQRLQAAVDEWVTLIDDTRETMPENSSSELEQTLKMPVEASKHSH